MQYKYMHIKNVIHDRFILFIMKIAITGKALHQEHMEVCGFHIWTYSILHSTLKLCQYWYWYILEMLKLREENDREEERRYHRYYQASLSQIKNGQHYKHFCNNSKNLKAWKHFIPHSYDRWCSVTDVVWSVCLLVVTPTSVIINYCRQKWIILLFSNEIYSKLLICIVTSLKYWQK